MSQQQTQVKRANPIAGSGNSGVGELPDAARTTVQGDPLADAACAQIAARLREATELVERGLGENLPAIRTLLEEAMDRTDAWVVARLCGADAGDGERATVCESAGDDPTNEALDEARGTRLRMSLLAQMRGEPVDEFLLIPFGQVSVERPVAGGDFAFTRKHAESAVRWFEQIGRKLAIDYEHQSFEQFNTRPDGLRPAAGWIGGLEVRGDGLWATRVTWTDRARELLGSGEYRYFSPVIYWADKEYSDVVGLGPVALTNDPAMHGVRPLAARRADGLGGLASGGPDAAVRSSEPLVDEAAALRERLDHSEREVVTLRRQLAAQAADAFVERGLRAGKILDSTSMDWREDYLRDPHGAESRLQRAPVVLAPGRVVELDPRGRVAGDDAIRSELSRNRQFYAQWGVEAEDLAAYERAAAAGRIKRYGGS